jgi:hypothetical protein
MMATFPGTYPKVLSILSIDGAVSRFPLFNTLPQHGHLEGITISDLPIVNSNDFCFALLLAKHSRRGAGFIVWYLWLYDFLCKYEEDVFTRRLLHVVHEASETWRGAMWP